MKWLLLIYFTQGGVTEKFMEFYKTKPECQEARLEKLKWNNKVTKVRAKCVNKVPKSN
jgi:hypothetical protein